MGRSIPESELEQAATVSEDSVTPVTSSATPESIIQPPRQLKPMNKPMRWLVWGSTLGLTAVISSSIGAILALVVPVPPAIVSNPDNNSSIGDIWRKNFGYRITRPVNILVMGIDEDPEAEDPDAVFSGRSDTMLLVRIDPTTQAASILSIPRDTRVRIPEVGMHKINHANMEGGSELAAQVTSRTLNGVTIDRYIRVHTAAFREMVDLLGGVEVFVPEPMYYEDQTQNLKIDLPQGRQFLNGEQAEQFARFRSDAYGDVGRVQRQQQLLRALRERVMNPAVVAKIPEAIQVFQKYIDTNLTTEEILALVEFGLDLQQDSFRMVMLPGRFSSPDEYVASYWIMDLQGRDQVMQEYFDVASSTAVVEPRDIHNLRIAIQNASSDPTLGRNVVNYLYDQGFDNVYLVRDWPDLQTQTQIIVQRGDLQGAAALETLLGVGQVVASSTGDLESDLTIRVGDDWLERTDSL